MVILSEVQKEHIRRYNANPEVIIYYIEKRCKGCKQGMTLAQLIDEALLMIEEQSFSKEDFDFSNNNE
jgi:hypothetical protein